MSLHKNRELSKSISPEPQDLIADEDMPMPSFARLTGPGRSAIAVLMLHGKGSKTVIQRCFQPANPAPFKTGQIRYGLWTGTQPEAAKKSETSGESNEQPAESVVITPGSDHVFEIHCHGGPAAVARIEIDLRACGAVAASDVDDWNPSDQSLLIREAEITLAECTTTRTAAIAMDQVRGTLLDWASDWRTSLTTVNLAVFRVELKSLLNAAPFTARLAEPFRVVLTGPPNVGKSSLLNALVGFDRSITLDMAGTTRDVLHANTVIAGLPVRISDTAGIRDHAAVETIEREGIRKAQLAVGAADLLLLICEPLPAGGHSKTPPHPPEIPHLRVLNKVDQQPKSSPATDDLADPFDANTNALSGEGLAELMVTIGARLGQHLPDPGKPALLNERQWEIMKQSSLADSPEQITELLDQLIGHNNG
jgi:tRNA modification GTPase